MQQSVKERVKLLRSSIGLTQNDFAAKIGKQVLSISNYENGKSEPRMPTLLDMVRVFGVDREWLINGVGEIAFEKNVEESRKSTSTSTWKEEAYSTLKSKADHLEQEVMFLRQLLTNMTGKAAANFNKAFFPAGVLEENIEESVRVAA